MRPRFGVGQRVRVRADATDRHCRTPRYVRGKRGAIERICGEFRNPETLAYGGDGLPRRPLYRVRFDQSVLWPDYAGSGQDLLELEIFEHWLDAEAECP